MIFGLVFCPLSHPKRIDVGDGTRCICSASLPMFEAARNESCESQMLIFPTLESLRKCDVRIPHHVLPLWTLMETGRVVVFPGSGDVGSGVLPNSSTGEHPSTIGNRIYSVGYNLSIYNL